jgi:opacity protein-like surface antigen
MNNTVLGRMCLSLAFLVALVGLSYGQNSDEINRVEFFGGFSHNRVDTGLSSEDLGPEFNSSFGRTLGANGVNLSITGNFSKYVGAKFDFATHSTSDDVTFEGDPFHIKYRITNYMGGIQVKNNKKDGPRVKPFFHALAGVARQSVTVTSPALVDVFGESSLKLTENNFTFAVGGGVDVRVHKHVDIRLFQVDYNPTYVKGRDFDTFETDAALQNNVRFSFGVVIH